MQIDQRVLDLYDEYCHGGIDRREFLSRSAALCAAGLVMAQALLPRYARAQTISFTDERIQAKYVTYPSPGGNSGTMRGYLVQPKGNGPFPTVLVVHENRGLNPYIEDVARRAAIAGFLALAPDGLFPAGGYPGNDDDGRTLQAGLDQAKLRTTERSSRSRRCEVCAMLKWFSITSRNAWVVAPSSPSRAAARRAIFPPAAE